jgi:hypothetical protein
VGVYRVRADKGWRASVNKIIDGVRRVFHGNYHADEEAAARQADE